MKAAILVMMIITLTCIPYVSAYPYNSSEQTVNQAIEWLRSQQQTNGSIGSFATSSWVVMAIVASGEDPHNWSNEGDSIIDYLKKNKESLSSPNDYSRFILSIVAAGENPRNVNGIDFVATLESFYNGTQFGDPSLLNDDFWAIMALRSVGIDNNDEKIQNAVAFIKTNQNEGDGGWSFGVGSDSDVDSTAASIMALISVNESKTSTHIIDGLEYIKTKQVSSGGFDSWGYGTSAESDSWAIQAIVAAGQDPTDANWTKEGKNPVDDLILFQNQDGSFNDFNPAPSSWTTSYAIPALLGKPYPIFMESSSQVYLRIEDQNSTLWNGWIDIPQSVTIEANNSGKTYNLAGDNVLAILDKASEIASFEYQVSDQWYQDMGFYVESIAGHKAEGLYGWLYLINYSSKEVAIDAYTITSSDEILIYWGAIDMKPLKINVNSMEVAINESFTVTVTYFNESNSEWIPLEGATVYVNDEFVTDSEGKVTVTLAESKVYDIYAEKWGETTEQQFVRSNITQVGVGVPIPEFNQYLPAMLIIIFATLIILRKRSSNNI